MKDFPGTWHKLHLETPLVDKIRLKEHSKITACLQAPHVSFFNKVQYILKTGLSYLLENWHRSIKSLGAVWQPSELLILNQEWISIKRFTIYYRTRGVISGHHFANL